MLYLRGGGGGGGGIAATARVFRGNTCSSSKSTIIVHCSHVCSRQSLGVLVQWKAILVLFRVHVFINWTDTKQNGMEWNI